MNIYTTYKQIISNTCRKLFPELAETNFNNFTVETPKEAKFGDLSTNIAMVLAKPLAKKPAEIANIIITELLANPSIAKAEVAGAGFINITLKNEYYQNLIPQILAEGKNFGRSNIGGGEKINLEFLSANPTGPMHIGHARNAVIGDVLANILKFSGYNVTKEYYINDAGVQVETLAKSTMIRLREAYGETIGEIPAGLYPGEYLVEVAEKFKLQMESTDGIPPLLAGEVRWGHFDTNSNNGLDNNLYAPLPASPRKQGEGSPSLLPTSGQNQSTINHQLSTIKEFAINEMLTLIKQDLEKLDVKFDVFTSEKSLHENKKLEESIEFLNKQNLLYRGILEAPKGKVIEDYEPREQLLFKAKEFGDDVDRPLQKSDGSYTYFSGDIAYHYDKISRGFNNLILVLGADHGGYVKRLSAVVSALSNKKAKVKILLSQLVKVVENGLPVKMSKRAGNFITMSEVVEKVGKDVVRFIMLTKKSDTTLDFDLKKVVETSKDNPIFYVQYASARICSVRRKAEEVFGVVDMNEVLEVKKGGEANAKTSENHQLATNLLASKLEISLIKKILEFPKIVENSAIHLEPHRITFYLYELASEFHQLWNVGKDEGIIFVDEANQELTKSRLALLECCRITIKNGLNLLGIEAVEKM